MSTLLLTDGRLIGKSKELDKKREREAESVYIVSVRATCERKRMCGCVRGREREREGAKFCVMYWSHPAPESQMN